MVKARRARSVPTHSVATRSVATRKQLALLRALAGLCARPTGGPTLGELAHALGLGAASSVHYRLRALAEAGWVAYARTAGEKRAATRTLRLTAAGERMLAACERLKTSALVRGERALALDARARTLADQLGLPLASYFAYWERDVQVLVMPQRGERDEWAVLLLQALE